MMTLISQMKIKRDRLREKGKRLQRNTKSLTELTKLSNSLFKKL